LLELVAMDPSEDEDEDSEFVRCEVKDFLMYGLRASMMGWVFFLADPAIRVRVIKSFISTLESEP
jgi:hypothetical protein